MVRQLWAVETLSYLYHYLWFLSVNHGKCSGEPWSRYHLCIINHGFSHWTMVRQWREMITLSSLYHYSWLLSVNHDKIVLRYGHIIISVSFIWVFISEPWYDSGEQWTHYYLCIINHGFCHWTMARQLWVIVTLSPLCIIYHGFLSVKNGYDSGEPWSTLSFLYH